MDQRSTVRSLSARSSFVGPRLDLFLPDFCLLRLTFLANTPSILAPVVTFAVFVGIAAARKDNSIMVAQAFTSLSLITVLTAPAMEFILAVPAIIQCIGCFDRIQEYCAQPISPRLLHADPQLLGQTAVGEHQSGTGIPLRTWTGPATDSDDRRRGPSQSTIIFKGQDFGWNKTGPAILKSIEIQILRNHLTVVLGPTGSGKSTLLESILGETIVFGDDHTERNFSSAAYCSQVPWLTSGTVRENIVGATTDSIDEKWYASVLWACCLEPDIALLSQGDQTTVGSNGSKLSGGQKQRIVSHQSLWEVLGDPHPLRHHIDTRNSRWLVQSIHERW